MAYTSLTDADLQPGKPVKSELFTQIDSNLDDLNSRVTTIEAGAGKVEIFNFPIYNASSASTLTGVSYYIAQADFSLVEAKIAIFEKGSYTGTIEIDLQLNSSGTGFDPADYVTVFSTKPSIALAGASDYDESSNAVFGSTAIQQGDYLRLDFSSLPSPGGFNFYIYIYGETS